MNTQFTESRTDKAPLKEDIPAILLVCPDKSDSNWENVPPRDKSKYLRQQYWIKQWSPLNRWPSLGFSGCGFGWWTDLHRVDLGQKWDDPGDAVLDLFLSTLECQVNLRTWIEVTEVFLSSEQAQKVDCFIRDYNNLPGKGNFDRNEFLQSLDCDLPNSHLQREMANRVISVIEKKVQKGREGGSYQRLVHDYGRGLLIVGLPLWSAFLPIAPTDLSTFHDDFIACLKFGLKDIEHSVLRTDWCPFDSVVVLWNPTLKSVDSWTKVADLNFYSDPANSHNGIPFSFLIENFPTATNISFPVRWDRYPSLSSMIIDYLKSTVQASKEGNPDDAIAYCTRLIALRPEFNASNSEIYLLPEIYVLRGAAYCDKGEFDLAITDFIKALQLEPNYANARFCLIGTYVLRGVAYLGKGEFDLAITDFIKALQLEPNYANARFCLIGTYALRGVAYCDKGEFDLAIINFTEALQLQVGFAGTHDYFAEIYFARGAAYLGKGEFDLAIADLTEALQLKPNNVGAYNSRGEAWLHLKKWEKAKADLSAAKDMGADIIAVFRNDYENVADFEQKHGVKLPENIAALLTPPQT